MLILGGPHVDTTWVLIRFSEMRVFSQMRFLNDFFESSEGEKAYMDKSHELNIVDIIVRR